MRIIFQIIARYLSLSSDWTEPSIFLSISNLNTLSVLPSNILCCFNQVLIMSAVIMEAVENHIRHSFILIVSF